MRPDSQRKCRVKFLEACNSTRGKMSSLRSRLSVRRLWRWTPHSRGRSGAVRGAGALVRVARGAGGEGARGLAEPGAVTLGLQKLRAVSRTSRFLRASVLG
jgi:hypothetical protein